MAVRRDEFSLIDQIRRQVVVSNRTRLGIGDDAALVSVAGGNGVLVAVDVLTEGVHFDLTKASPEAVGRKALAVNLSDIAAMAGEPTATVIGLVLPRDRAERLTGQFMNGLIGIAAEFNVDIIGGDTNIWDGPMVMSVTLLGEPTSGRVVTRCGARPGDGVFVTGALGGSLEGRHLTFPPRVDEAQALHRAVDLHAMIDLSDGISSDVRHIARESGVGVVLDAETIPIHDDVAASLSPEHRLLRALSDGEDFELLFTVSEADGRTLLERSPVDVSLTRIGEIRADGGCQLRQSDGRLEPLPEGGWTHRFDAP